jgi:hypothetical protein
MFPGQARARTSADLSPLIARDVEVGAQRPPDVTRVDAVFDGLRRGAPAERGQYVVDEQRPPPHGSEVALDKLVEFGQPHPINLR